MTRSVVVGRWIVACLSGAVAAFVGVALVLPPWDIAMWWAIVAIAIGAALLASLFRYRFPYAYWRRATQGAFGALGIGVAVGLCFGIPVILEMYGMFNAQAVLAAHSIGPHPPIAPLVLPVRSDCGVCYQHISYSVNGTVRDGTLAGTLTTVRDSTVIVFDRRHPSHAMTYTDWSHGFGQSEVLSVILIVAGIAWIFLCASVLRRLVRKRELSDSAI
jgi:hypothetical protein